MPPVWATVTLTPTPTDVATLQERCARLARELIDCREGLTPTPTPTRFPEVLHPTMVDELYKTLALRSACDSGCWRVTTDGERYRGEWRLSADHKWGPLLSSCPTETEAWDSVMLLRSFLRAKHGHVWSPVNTPEPCESVTIIAGPGRILRPGDPTPDPCETLNGLEEAKQ